MRVVIVVLPKLEDAKKIRKILIGHGFSNVFAVPNASAALLAAGEHSSGLIISGYRLADMYYLDLYDHLPKYFELILIGRADTIAEASFGILSLATPLKVYDLVNTAEMVLNQLKRRMQKESVQKKRSEKEQNYIRNAKFLLMERNHLTEEEAYRYIQKCSMDNGTNMAETAQMILSLMYDEE